MDEREFLYELRKVIKETERINLLIKIRLHELVQECKFYEYDQDAFEESCSNPKMESLRKAKVLGVIVAKKEDFDSEKECLQCKHFEKRNK